MAVLIKSGRRVCNQTCYDAKGPADKCKCICGGMNHGVGKKEALKRTWNYATVLHEQADSMIQNCYKVEIKDAGTKVQDVFGGTNMGISL